MKEVLFEALASERKAEDVFGIPGVGGEMCLYFSIWAADLSRVRRCPMALMLLEVDRAK